MEKREIKPSVYEWRESTIVSELKDSKVYVSKRVKNDKAYYDLVVELQGRKFAVKQAPFYSIKTKCLYEHLIKDIVLAEIDKSVDSKK